MGCRLSRVSCQMEDLERWLGQLHQMWMGGGKTGDWHPDKMVVVCWKYPWVGLGMVGKSQEDACNLVPLHQV